MKPILLVLIALSDPHLESIRRHCDVLYAPDAAQRAACLAAEGHKVQVVLTNGSTGLHADELDALPALTLACAFGAGYENLALDALAARGVTVVNGAGTNDDCVADHAMALLLAVVRGLPAQDAALRRGVWRDHLPLRPTVTGKRLGIVGLGAIGRKIAQRGLGFDMHVGYHNRRAAEAAAYRWFDSAEALAAWCDCLVVATPGGAATRHLIDARVLQALGPKGFLVNISRGSVVDTAALADALRGQRIAGAALDVYEGEPEPPAALLDLPDVLLTPHVAGWSPESMQASVDLFIENQRRHFAGEPVLTPITA